MRFLLPIQRPRSRLRMRPMGECVIQSVSRKALANADHRVATHLEHFSDLFIGPARAGSVAINFEQDTRMAEFARRGFAFGNQLVERVALLLA